MFTPITGADNSEVVRGRGKCRMKPSSKETDYPSLPPVGQGFRVPLSLGEEGSISSWEICGGAGSLSQPG